MSKTTLNLSAEQLTKALTDMLRIRVFEERCAQLYGIRKIGGFCHLYTGQEAVAVGAVAAMQSGTDYVLTSYRDHGHILAMGGSAKTVMAELFGKITGCSKGKGGSMHLFDVERRFFGGNGIVGSQIPVATGTAFAQAYRKEKGATLCFFGDGAIHQGAFHESINLASVWKLPVIYFLEDNVYGMGTAVSRISGIKSFVDLAKSYQVHADEVNGMDFFDVYAKTKKALELAYKKRTPSFLHVKTYRYRGHSMSDPAKYRSRQEVEEFRKQDPIQTMKHHLIEQKTLSEKDYAQINEAIIKEVDEAVKFAEESPIPSPDELYTDVLVD